MSNQFYPPPRGSDELPPDYTATQFETGNVNHYYPPQAQPYPAGNPEQFPPGSNYEPQMPSYGASVPYYPSSGQYPKLPAQQYPQPNQPGQPGMGYSGGQNPSVFVVPPVNPEVDQQSRSSHDSNTFSSSFSEKAIRHAFIKKVFGILTLQLLLTSGICCIFFFSETVKEWNEDTIWPMIAAIVSYIVLMIVLSCCDSVRRAFPLNITCLILFTVATGWLLGAITARYDSKEVLMALGITIAIVIGMMILGFQQKYDFTVALGAMCILTIGLLGFGLLCLIIQSDYLNLVYAVLGAILFSFWLLIDIQMIVGGKRKYTYSPEDYIFAALNVYLDIVNIFMMLLYILK